MAKALKCDRCGGFYDYIKALRKYQIHDMDAVDNKTVDLCPDCYEKLCDFLYVKPEMLLEEEENAGGMSLGIG